MANPVRSGLYAPRATRSERAGLFVDPPAPPELRGGRAGRAVGLPAPRTRQCGRGQLPVTFLLALFLALNVPLLHAQPPGDEGAATSLAAAPPGPSFDALQAVHRLLLAQRFTLETPYTYAWSRESLEVRSGSVLVLEVDPAFCQPLQTGMAVLYAGTRPAEIVNGGNEAGRIIAIVPGDIDLADTLVFFGSTVLPERVDAARGREELDAAQALGLAPFSALELDGAVAAGGAPLEARDVDDLYRGLAGVVAAYSPEEADLIGALRLIP